MSAQPKLGRKTTFNVQEAKTQLSELLARVEKGEAITIARANRPIAQLTPLPAPRQWGTAAGQIRMTDDFNAPMPEFEAQFYGEAAPKR